MKMAAIIGGTRLGLREIGHETTVDEVPKAILMYYLNCICSLLDLEDQQNIRRLKDHKNHHLLTEDETDSLIMLCFLFSPDVLTGKVMFQDDDMCRGLGNRFYELSAVRTNLLLSDSIMIGGQQRAVHKIMAFTKNWLRKNWMEPMQHYSSRMDRIATGQPGQPPRQPLQTQRPAVAYNNPPNTSFGSRAVVYQVPPEERNNATSNDCCCVIL